MLIRLPHAHGHDADAMEFVAAWQVVGELYGPEGWEWRTDAMPCNLRRQLLVDVLASGLHFGVDVLCRCLAPSSYRNTMHATGEFRRENLGALEPCETENPTSGRRVSAMRLTGALVEAWSTLPEPEQAALLSRCGVMVRELLGDPPLARPRPPSRPGPGRGTLVPSRKASRPDWWRPAQPPADLALAVASCPQAAVTDVALHALVEWVQREAFQPRGRGGSAVGAPVVGWDQRLLSYFWPKPDVGYADERDRFAAFQALAAPLADALEQRGGWDSAESLAAVRFADSVFEWGGVRQRLTPATPTRVLEVMYNALGERLRYPTALMNSGWTKVAAFGTAHLEGRPGRTPQVIWDSRVSTAVTWRLDRLLTGAGIRELPAQLRGIGSVQGRGGSRPRPLELAWGNGYGSWECQFEASRLVARMRDILNAGTRLGTGELHPRMPLPDGQAQPWTVRGTEMVLFMDGY